MASSSNSEFTDIYDVFLSFRGLDTRKKFTDHLYENLKQAKFHTFRDDDEIPKGKFIKPELRKAIMNSRMSVIVLSKNYANSTACLFELQLILEHVKTLDHFVLPVFFEVDPQEIKQQAKNLHFEEKKVTEEEVKGWSEALKDVARMKGMVSQNQCDGYEAKFIGEIVGTIKRMLAGSHLRVAHHQEFEKNMKILKRELMYLSAQEDDINRQITNAEHRPWKRPKTEVKVWVRDVQLLKDKLQRLDQEIDGESNSFSCLQGKHITEKIQEVEILREKGRAFNDLLVDEVPIGKLPIPLMEDFVESTEARNVERVLESLMNTNDRRIGVFGMGGVGKTTIMTHIHNQLLKETGKFDSVVWVTVSKPFSVTNLQSDLAKGLNCRSILSLDDNDLTRAAKLQAELCRRKRYVLIIDDMWEAFTLESVGIPSPTIENGCKLVLTTRLFEVCKKMRCKTVKVELLTEQEALRLFLSKAVEDDSVLATEVKDIAARIAKKCARLPLAIVTVAGSLQGLEETCEWRNALTELTSSTKDARDSESELFEVLKFSYSRLREEMHKKSFLYVSLYPEDHNIPVDELIEYWIAEKIIDNTYRSVEEQFDKGHTILGVLTRSCLLERFDDISFRRCVKMHDSIRDMAIRITRSHPRFMVKAGERDSVGYGHWSEDLERISFMGSRITELPITPPFCPRLTTLFLNDTELTEIPDSFFTHMQLLGVLNLANNHSITSLPESTFNLVNLHALILGGCWRLRNVPSLENLKALTVFILTLSLVKKLPEGIEELVNLVKLDLSGNFNLEDFPTSKICRLSKLRFLRLDGTKVKVSAEDLKCLKALKVVAVQFPNITELTSYVTSQQCQGLENYLLIVGEENDYWEEINRKQVRINSEWINPESESDSEPLESGVVDQPVLPANMDCFGLYNIHNIIDLSTIPSLKDARDLRHCVFNDCRKLESIFSYSSFSKDGRIFLGTVEKLELHELPRCRGLFDWIAPLQNISFNLKSLTIRRCCKMEYIFPVQILQNFPNLEELWVFCCDKVEDIIVKKEEMSNQDHGPHNIDTINFPKLRILRIEDLPRLKSIYNGMMVCEAIQEVRVKACDMVKRLPLSLQAAAPPSPDKKKTAPPSLKFILGRVNWWEDLEWDDPDAKGILQPFFKQGYYDW